MNRYWISLGLWAVMAPAYGVNTSADYRALPAVLSGTGTPIVMLAMSQDHQLFYKAYTDWDDLDGDALGQAETTYTHSVEYFGYFDPDKCYVYDELEQLFEPAAITSDRYCDGAGQWAGNFLNWGTTTRIDAVRKILYGGSRVAQRSNGDWVFEHQWPDAVSELPARTVLERTYLPNDAHSFAKYYAGQDLGGGVNDLGRLTPFSPPLSGDASDVGITLCNTTDQASGLSQNATAAPRFAMARGNHALWGANERFQCLWNNDSRLTGDRGTNDNDPAVSGIAASDDSPARSDHSTNRDYIVRVEVCRATLLGSERCKQYPDGTLKPVGLLQEYGDDDRVWFGLMTGSYRANKSGGVLRKNPGTLSDEVDVGGSGRFLSSPAQGNIVTTLDSMRPYGYDHSDGRYNVGDNCAWGRNAFNNDQCRNWGNPLSEIVLECYRYLAGATATSAFDANDAGLPNLDANSPIRDLVTASWSNPLTEANSCAKLNVIAFNASTSSYDTDELSGVADLNTSLSADQLTDVVGAGEGLHTQSAFVGRVAGDTDELCTPKTIDALSEVQGTCPDAPRLQGGYHIAGLAHHVSQTDVRPAQSPTQDDYPGVQNITTYGVALTPTLPKVRVPVPGSSPQAFVTVLPACINQSVGGNCGLVDFKITQPYTEVAGVGTGAFYVNWEDSEQGGDYDQDLAGVLSYSISASGLTIQTDSFGQSTPNRMGFGFIVSGTTQDGFHAFSGINGFNRTNPGTVPDCANCNVANAAVSHTFTLGDDTALLLEQPLYYAAKWGGFSDADGDGTPNLQAEWDRKDNSTGAFAPDGIPDNYFLAIDPAQLNEQLGLVLEDIINRTAAGTGGAVVANSVSGLGAVYQALYQPQFKSGDRSVDWVGLVHALFIDDNGFLREDNDQDGQLDDYLTDYVVDVSYDALSDATLVTRFSSADGGATLTPVGDPVALDQLKPIWNARDQLAQIDNPKGNRTYSNLASTRRYLITAAGPGLDNRIDQDDVVPFVPATFRDRPEMDRALNRPGGVPRSALINWVRGFEDDRFRSRTVDFLPAPGEEVWRLGDVIHSTPTPVGAPNAGFDALYGDTSYLAFKSQYANRRTVVYVGANDGMLHAFNGGFWNESLRKFDTASPDGTVTEHPLGSELWGYVPFNLLPHLKWLVEEDYPHVYYVDGRPTVFDARIFDATDSDHPGGWGTVLAVTLRFGGGAYFVDWDGQAGNGPGGSDAELRMRSTVVLFDVTNPESPPQLLLELHDTQLDDFFFTTAQPSVLHNYQPGSGSDWNNPAVNQWNLMFGTGPDNLSSGTRAAQAGVYLLDLATRGFKTGFSPMALTDAPSSFVGDARSVDWDVDGITDASYFGITGGDALAPSGGLKRLTQTAEGSFAVSSVLAPATDTPITTAPSLTTDKQGRRWIHVGTGRLLVSADNQSTAPQAFFGLMETSTLDARVTDWVDVAGLDRAEDGSITPSDFEIDSELIATVDQLNDKIVQRGAWRRLMSQDGSSPSGRVIEPAVTLEDLVLFTEYQPDGLLCQPSGSSRLYGLDLANGVRRLDSGLTIDDGSDETLVTRVVISSGLAFSPLIHSSTGEFGGSQVIVADDKGGYTFQSVLLPTIQGGRESWRQIAW